MKKRTYNILFYAIITWMIVAMPLGAIIGSSMARPNAYKQGFESGRQSVLDSLHYDTLLMIKEVDSIIVRGKTMFPNNQAYEAWMEEMLKRKNKEK